MSQPIGNLVYARGNFAPAVYFDLMHLAPDIPSEHLKANAQKEAL